MKPAFRRPKTFRPGTSRNRQEMRLTNGVGCFCVVLLKDDLVRSSPNQHKIWVDLSKMRDLSKMKGCGQQQSPRRCQGNRYGARKVGTASRLGRTASEKGTEGDYFPRGPCPCGRLLGMVLLDQSGTVRPCHWGDVLGAVPC